METTTAKRVLCPVCKSKAKRVRIATLSALLSNGIAQKFKPNEDSCCASDAEGCESIRADTGWRFCDSKDCDVVYFSEDDDTVFNKSQLKVPVGVKKSSGDRPLCYCFGHSVASIKDQIAATGQSNALEDIRANMKDPCCRCETENPSGSCCLGSVGKGIKVAQAELAVADSASQTPTHAQSSGNKGEKIAKIGTVLSAIMASACCWLPLVLLAVGVSGAGIASTLESYRPLFIAITFGFLASAFYFTYRPQKAATAPGHDCCAPATSRFNMMTMNKVMLWAVTVMAVAFLFFPSYVGFLFGTGSETPLSANMYRVEFEVEGMTCEGCATVAEQAIRQVPEVFAVEVDYAAGKAVVGTDSCCPFPQNQILAALESVGYKGELVNQVE